MIGLNCCGQLFKAGLAPLICIILDHAFKIKFLGHRRHLGTPGPVFFAGVRVMF